jgi:hypothetical protein
VVRVYLPCSCFCCVLVFRFGVAHQTPSSVCNARRRRTQALRSNSSSVVRISPESVDALSQSLRIDVHVMTTKAHRDALFSSDDLDGISAHSVFVWAGSGSPFSADGGSGPPDEVGTRMMRFLCLVAEWEQENLAEALFSAIGVRVVDVLHRK